LRTSFRGLSKSLIVGVAAGALAISGLAVALTASPAGAVTTNVIGGANRYDTARLAALAQFPGGAANAILATGENFPDGLSASDVAGALGAPLLLTPTASLAPETTSALASLHVHTVQIVGGPAAVSAAVLP
jgi:putative cell wall-binding protein